MRKTLYFKLVLAWIFFGLLGFLTVATFVSRLTSEHTRRKYAGDLYREATEIAGSFASDLYNSETSLDTVQKELAVFSAYNQAEIWILNPSGRLVVSSARPADPDSEIVIGGFDPTEAEGSFYMTGTFHDSFQEPQLTVIAPITETYKVRGYVLIHYPLSRMEKEADSLLNISYMELLFLFLLSIMILVVFTEVVYRPLTKIIHATEQYASGNMHYKLGVESDDELGYLSASLQYMASQIARSEDDQKKFIANVSHDFRSPLTSIRGFLEAMLDGTIPPERFPHYLQVVLKETERLTKLTNGLLALNNLNTRGMLLQYTDFDINQTIRDVCSSFEQVCRSRDIRFSLILSGETLYVSADQEKIQQVLYNLIDNALKFSRNGSQILIETTEKKNKVLISVKDYGIGIPREDQKMIWERFYKSDLSRGKDKKGTGLGLSIVREIIRAHDETISLISTEGVGSEFIFTLKKARQDPPPEGESPEEETPA